MISTAMLLGVTHITTSNQPKAQLGASFRNGFDYYISTTNKQTNKHIPHVGLLEGYAGVL